LPLARLSEFVERNGLAEVTAVRAGAMKFVDARASYASKVRFPAKARLDCSFWTIPWNAALAVLANLELLQIWA
jgi:hypothetical protein